MCTYLVPYIFIDLFLTLSQLTVRDQLLQLLLRLLTLLVPHPQAFQDKVHFPIDGRQLSSCILISDVLLSDALIDIINLFLHGAHLEIVVIDDICK